jgi:hypothetical protein
LEDTHSTLLVDTTGCIQRQDKRGFIPETLLPILQHLAIDADEWIVNTQKFEELFYKKFYYRRNTAYLSTEPICSILDLRSQILLAYNLGF